MSLEVQPLSFRNPTFYRDIIDGLSLTPPTIASKYLYDQRGSQLFEQICDLPEYYVTRTELELTRDCAADLADHLGPRPRLIELGSGSGLKTKILLRELSDVASYIPVDISPAALDHCATDLGAHFPDLPIRPVCADYTTDFDLPQDIPQGRDIIYYPGSTIGNFLPAEARGFLARMARLVGPGGHLVIGVDLEKNQTILEAAYNDSQGITADFNLNLLHRINRECDASFNPDTFRHRAIYNQDRHRIEMHLISERDQEVFFPTERFHFAEGDHIVTEYSHKFTIERFITLSEAAGWRTRALWTDNRQYFSLWLLEACP